MRQRLRALQLQRAKRDEIRGVKTELQPRKKVNDKDAIVLLVSPKSGSPVKMFFDAETCLLLMIKLSTLSHNVAIDDEMFKR